MKEFTPGETFPITEEAENASIEGLLEQARQAPEIAFVNHLLEQFPYSRVVLVGGIIRDSILGLPSKDYDLVIEGVEQKALEEFLKDHGSIELVEGRAFGVNKFQPTGCEGEPVDIAIPRTEKYEPGKRAKDAEVVTENVTIEEDFARRDFTMNALGLDLATGQLVDPFGGLEDVRNRTIRAVGDPDERFIDDPSRILRMIRFASKYDFAIESETFAAAKRCRWEINKLYPNQYGDMIPRVSTEKAREEIEKGLMGKPDKFIKLCDDTENGINILSQYFPGLTNLKDVPQPPEFHSEGDAYTHTLLALENLSPEASLSTRYATLLHDLGKVDTIKYPEKEGERISFHGHAKYSVIKAREILNNLRVPNNTIYSALWQIENHMDMLSSFAQMRPNKQLKLAQHADFYGLLMLAEADSRASHRQDGTINLAFLDAAAQAIGKSESLGGDREIITGNDITSAVRDRNPNYRLGPSIGEIKTAVNNAYINGEFADPDPVVRKEKALKYMHRLIASKIPKGSSIEE